MDVTRIKQEIQKEITRKKTVISKVQKELDKLQATLTALTSLKPTKPKQVRAPRTKRRTPGKRRQCALPSCKKHFIAYRTDNYYCSPAHNKLGLKQGIKLVPNRAHKKGASPKAPTTPTPPTPDPEIRQHTEEAKKEMASRKGYTLLKGDALKAASH